MGQWVPVRCSTNCRVGERVRLLWLPGQFKEGVLANAARRCHFPVRLDSGGFIVYDRLTVKRQPIAWRERRTHAAT